MGHGVPGYGMTKTRGLVVNTGLSGKHGEPFFHQNMNFRH